MNDFRYALRQLWRAPGFAAIAVITLALGIGANAAIVTMIQTLVFKPVAAYEPHRLAGIFQRDVRDPDDYRFFSFADFTDLRADKSVWKDLAAFNMAQVAVREGDYVRRASALIVSANYFSALGVPPLLGRVFVQEEETKPAAVAVLGHAYWKHLGGQASLLGSNLRLPQGDFTIVGVMPESFTGTDVTQPDLFLPTGATAILWSHPGEVSRALTDTGSRMFMLFARLQDGLDLPKANARLKALSERFRIDNPKDGKPREIEAAKLSRFSFSDRPSLFAQRVAPLASLAMALAVTVLAVACLNLANMLLARGAARRKEIAVRLAIGASRGRILRQMLCEGVLLAFIGGVAGMALAQWSTTALAAVFNAGMRSNVFRLGLLPDPSVLGALLMLCGLATIFFALGPAWKLASLNLNSGMKLDGAAHVLDLPGNLNLKSALVVGQLALSLAVLAAAGLFTRSALNAISSNPGFEMDQSIVAKIDGGLVNFDNNLTRRLLEQAEERTTALPGVEAASLAMFVPFGQEFWLRDVQLGGAPPPTDAARSLAEGEPLQVMYNTVTADYFRTIGMPLLSGREFTRSESWATPPVPIAIITRDLAERLWPGQDPLGRSIQFPPDNPNGQPLVMQVVGVAPKMLWEIFEDDHAGMVITPLGQDFHSTMRLHVRALPNADPASVMGLVRQTLRDIDPEMPLVELRPLNLIHSQSMSVRLANLGAAVFGAFGGVALLLSFVGVYGLKSYSVQRRVREIGIRMALGATARDVLKMILSEGFRLTTIGIAIGLALAALLGQLATKFLYGVSAVDPLTFLAVPIALAVVALIACWLPARRATRINPMTALRCD